MNKITQILLDILAKKISNVGKIRKSIPCTKLIKNYEFLIELSYKFINWKFVKIFACFRNKNDQNHN